MKRAGQTGGSIGAGLGFGLAGPAGSAIGGGIGAIIGYAAGSRSAQKSQREECRHKKAACLVDLKWYYSCVASCKAAGIGNSGDIITSPGGS